MSAEKFSEFAKGEADRQFHISQQEYEANKLKIESDREIAKVQYEIERMKFEIQKEELRIREKQMTQYFEIKMRKLKVQEKFLDVQLEQIKKGIPVHFASNPGFFGTFNQKKPQVSPSQQNQNPGVNRHQSNQNINNGPR